MDILVIKSKMSFYTRGETDRHYSSMSMAYRNDYLEVVVVENSNRWISPNKMEKMWSVIYVPKKPFETLTGFRLLAETYGIYISPVKRGRNEGKYGLRVPGMSKEPDTDIIISLLDFIFKYDDK